MVKKQTHADSEIRGAGSPKKKPKLKSAPPKMLTEDGIIKKPKRKRVHRGTFKKSENKVRKNTRKVKVEKGILDPEIKRKKPKAVSKNIASVVQKTPSNLRQKLLSKLKASKFRHINEELYTQNGDDAWKMFEQDSQLFNQYHSGFTAQAASWPLNPLDIIIKDLTKLTPKTRIADMGCGEARLSESLPQHKVHSYDLVAVNSRVTACQMSHTPLKDGKMDVVVFSLSLMGQNATEYIIEANRVLKMGGILKIAEIISRISSIMDFHRALNKLGFDLVKETRPNDMFVLFKFQKKRVPNSTNEKKGLKLLPCLYKKR